MINVTCDMLDCKANLGVAGGSVVNLLGLEYDFCAKCHQSLKKFIDTQLQPGRESLFTTLAHSFSEAPPGIELAGNEGVMLTKGKENEPKDF